MGFLDKAKEQMAVATTVAKDAAQKGQAKIDAAQAKRAADALLRDLGAASYAQQTGRASDATPAEIERLTTALREHETAHGQIDLGPEAPPS
ncbi:MAG: hypothetical protein ACLP62_13485 [Acidimicrobiales bacterium]